MSSRMMSKTQFSKVKIMLTDRHTMMVQSLLKIQFPEIDGLLSPTLGPAGQFPPTANEFVQSVNTMKSHWVCL